MPDNQINRRDFMKLGAAGAVAASLPARSAEKRNIRRVGIEEAFVTSGIAKAWEDVINTPGLEPGYKRLGGLVHVSPGGRKIIKKLKELGEPRLRDMETTGVDFQVLSIASPGVQVFAPALGVSLAREANDYLHDAVQKHPDKFAGLATIAPQAPEAAAKELERCMTKLDFRGALINSHTKGEHLDNEKFYPILEAGQCVKSAYLSTSAHAAAEHAGTVSGLRPVLRPLGFRRGGESARGASHLQRIVRTLSPISNSSSATWARACRSGYSVWTAVFKWPRTWAAAL